jgi:NitT/TauT family transport system substrate-binding protein
MMAKKHVWRGIRLAAMLIAFLSIGGHQLNAHAQSAARSNSLKIALLPILDSLPFYVAQDKHFFDSLGIYVTAAPVSSGLERDQLMQSGEIDGMLNEMTSTANFNRDRIRLKIVTSARKAYPRYPLFRVLSAPGSSLTSPQMWAGTPIGVSKNTIIEYVTDRLLMETGLVAERIVKKSVPVIPERYQLLLQGRLQAATLPDPLAKSAIVSGALEVIADSAYPRFSVSVISFAVDSLSAKTDTVKLFLKAWDQATAAINADPEAYRKILLNHIRVPENVQSIYKIPPYPRRELPGVEQWNDVIQWMMSKGLLTAPISYKGSVTSDFLPRPD